MDEVDGGLGWAVDGCLIVIVAGGRENRLPVPRALDLVLVAGVANRRERPALSVLPSPPTMLLRCLVAVDALPEAAGVLAAWDSHGGIGVATDPAAALFERPRSRT